MGLFQQTELTYVIVGIGGVGSHLVGPLCRYLAVTNPGAEVRLIDGDEFEFKNRERQDFTAFGNKADVKAAELREQFPELRITSRPEYVTGANVSDFVPDKSVIFSCPDNHATRKLLSDHVEGLDTAMLISGGNDYHDGSGQLYLRVDSNDMSPPLTHNHPEVANPADKNPAELSCAEKAMAGSPQLIFTNFKAASEMLATFWAVSNLKKGDKVPYTEFYFDLSRGSQRAVTRKGEYANDHPSQETDVDLSDQPGRVSA